MTTNQNPARTVEIRTDNHQIVSVYNRRWLVQFYNKCNGSWFTEKIIDTTIEDAKEYLRKHLS